MATFQQEVGKATELFKDLCVAESQTLVPASLLHLPDEILLQITQNILGKDATKDLRQLALAHRNFRGAVHETLVKNAVVSLHGMPTYIQLLSQHPIWAASITSVTWSPTCKHSSTQFAAQIPAMYTAYCKLVSAFWTGAKADELRELFEKDVDTWAPITVLLACLPNAKHVFVRQPIAHHNVVATWLLDEPLGHTSIYFFDRLETLGVTPYTSRLFEKTRGRAFRPIGYSKLCNLKVLEQSFCNLESSTSLPPKLEVLRIWCDHSWSLWEFMGSLYDSRIKNQNPKHLRHVQLFFDLPLKDVASRICHNQQQTYYGTPLTILQLWESSAHQVLFETLFPDPYASQFIQGSYKSRSLVNAIQEA